MKLTVNLKENSYPIYIENGILNRAGEYIADLFHGQRIMIVSDDNVFPLYGKQLCDSLSGYECHSRPPSWRTDKKFRHTSESLLRNA